MYVTPSAWPTSPRPPCVPRKAGPAPEPCVARSGGQPEQQVAWSRPAVGGEVRRTLRVRHGKSAGLRAVLRFQAEARALGAWPLGPKLGADRAHARARLPTSPPAPGGAEIRTSHTPESGSPFATARP